MKKQTLTDSELDYCNAEGIKPADFLKQKAPGKVKKTKSLWASGKKWDQFIFNFPEIITWIYRTRITANTETSVEVLCLMDILDSTWTNNGNLHKCAPSQVIARRLLVQQIIESFPQKKVSIMVKCKWRTSEEPEVLV